MFHYQFYDPVFFWVSNIQRTRRNRADRISSEKNRELSTMNLFDLFKGKAKDIAVSGSSLGTMNRTDSRPSPNQLAPAATSWADTALNAGRALRGAVERGDIETAKAAFAKRADAMDRARGYDGTDG